MRYRLWWPYERRNRAIKYPAGAHKPEYETLSMFGSNCLNDNLSRLSKLTISVIAYGIDTISAGATMPWLLIATRMEWLIKKIPGHWIDLGNHKSIVGNDWENGYARKGLALFWPMEPAKLRRESAGELINTPCRWEDKNSLPMIRSSI